MRVNVALYGSIARFGGGLHVAQFDTSLPVGACAGDLLQTLGIPAEERGYLFINAVLSDAPGLNASVDEALKDGDHVGIFSIHHMWPYQYRDGIAMSKKMKQILQERGAMHHSYENGDGEQNTPPEVR